MNICRVEGIFILDHRGWLFGTDSESWTRGERLVVFFLLAGFIPFVLGAAVKRWYSELFLFRNNSLSFDGHDIRKKTRDWRRCWGR